MNSKKLLILAGALAVAAVAVMLLDKQSGPSISEKTALIPGLERDINNVVAISNTVYYCLNRRHLFGPCSN